jgi:hypothetical protein
MGKRTIQAYKQSADPRWWAGEVKPSAMRGALTKDDFEKTDTSEGVCFGLSIWWIIKRGKGEDFWTWMEGPGPHVTEIKSLFNSQKGEYEFSRFDAAGKKITSLTSMKQACKVLMNQGTSFKYPAYYYISIRGKFGNGATGSGHAIAAHVNPTGKCRYFDPNVGEYETDTLEETLQELGALVRGYKVKDLKIYWCCWS